MENSKNILSYEEFKNEVVSKLLDFMPAKYAGYKVEVSPITKVNTVLDGLCLRYKDNFISPTLYINQLYADYDMCKDLDEVLSKAGKLMADAFNNLPARNIKDLKFDEAKDNIILTLVNTQKNEALLKKVPHREFLDLSIIYRWVLEERHGQASVIITNALADTIGLSEDELYNYAWKNTVRLQHPHTIPIAEALAKIMKVPLEDLDEDLDEDLGLTDRDDMYILTYSSQINGAGAMVFQTLLEQLAYKWNDDIYILPSSIHECIAVNAAMGNAHDLRDMVKQINGSEVLPEEQLSDNVYFYNRNNKTISIAD